MPGNIYQTAAFCGDTKLVRLSVLGQGVRRKACLLFDVLLILLFPELNIWFRCIGLLAFEYPRSGTSTIMIIITAELYLF